MEIQPLNTRTIQKVEPDGWACHQAYRMGVGQKVLYMGCPLGKATKNIFDFSTTKIGNEFPMAMSHMAMGQNPVSPVNIPIPTKIGSKMGGAPNNSRWYQNGFDPRPCQRVPSEKAARKPRSLLDGRAARAVIWPLAIRKLTPLAIHPNR